MKSIQTFTLTLVKDRTIRYRVPKVQDHKDAALAMRAYLQDCDCEHLAVLMMDNDGNIIGITTVGIGSLGATVARMRDLFKAAIVANAGSIILGHNHPSGNVNPSPQDIAFFNKAKAAGEIMGIPVLDSLIVSSGINQDICSLFDRNAA